MRAGTSIASLQLRTLLGAALLMAISGAAAAQESKYPDMKGQWRRATSERGGLLAGGAGALRYDESKPPQLTPNLGQEPPLTPEYQKIYDDNLEDMIKGGQGIDPTASCLAGGMPRVMIGYTPLEFVVTPEITYIMFERDHDFMRHIYTDGRSFPPNMDEDPKFLGYSIGKWSDTGGDGKYDLLEVETRGLKGPRVFDATGIPLHSDNATMIQERFQLDKSDKNLVHVEITTHDHALTRPWVVNKAFRRVVTNQPIWFNHSVCGEGNNHVKVGGEYYFRSFDGQLMPTKKGQKPPDLRYFNVRQ
jgi:hypothetical protein